jgi:hypothetical protein
MIPTIARIISSKRMWMHMPLRYVNCVWLVILPPLGMGLLWAFLAYELNQCATTGDNAFNDILGHLVGIIIAGIVCSLALVLTILWIGGIAWR